MMWSMAATATLYGVADYGVSLFSKKARGNHRDDGLRGVEDAALDEIYRGLKGKLTAAEKALKERIKTEQKVRERRNSQKKSGEKGTGTGTGRR